MNINDYKTDAALENDGVLVAFDDAKLRIASFGTKQHKQAVAKFRQKYSAQLAIKRTADEANEQVTIEVMAEAILVGWENVTEGDEPLPYTRDNAIKLLSIRTFRDFVAMQATDIQNFRAVTDEQKEAVELWVTSNCNEAREDEQNCNLMP